MAAALNKIQAWEGKALVKELDFNQEPDFNKDLNCNQGLDFEEELAFLRELNIGEACLKPQDPSPEAPSQKAPLSEAHLAEGPSSEALLPGISLSEKTGQKPDIGENPAQLPPLALAYLGDAVYELMVRRYFMEAGVLKVKELHRLAIGEVCASRQALFAQNILGELSREELDIYKRGRNAKSGHQPPNMSVTDYRRATGLEALIGYLYLGKQIKRLAWLFERLFALK